MSGSKEVKEFLRENGIDTKDIRVSGGSSINVKLLDPKLDFERIDSLLKEKFESYRKDSATDEILSGGNRFVFVKFDEYLISEIQEKLQPTILPFLKTCSGYWSIPGLVTHYVETQELEYNVIIVRQAIREALYLFLKANPEKIDGLSIDRWN